jgi:carbon monoxide dehydrogenase subunit G
MATSRAHIRISKPPEEVWRVVSDAGAIATWFPAIETSTVSGGHRSATMAGGGTIEEDIVTNDPQLRRFQYRIVGGDLPVTFHLGTIDVLDDPGGSLVIYSTDITPDELAGVLGPATAAGLQGLKELCEG